MGSSKLQTRIGCGLILASFLAIAGIADEATHLHVLEMYVHDKMGTYPDIVENILHSMDGIPGSQIRLAERVVEPAALFGAGVWTIRRS